MKFVPFTVHIKIVPANPDKRFENWRDMQKIAAMAYNGLLALSPDITVAEPGGGQHTSYSGIQAGGIGGMTPGLAVKPQFGETPSQMSITGFYKVSNANIQPQPESMLISSGEKFTASRNNKWEAGPKTAIDNQVAALKSAIEAAIDATLPATVVFEVYRIDYSNVIYGNKGYHFP